MKKIFLNGIVIGTVVVMGLLAGCGSNQAKVASLKEPKGTVQVRAAAQGDLVAGKEGDVFSAGGAVKTGENSTAQIVFEDKTEVQVKPEAYFEIGTGKDLGKQTSGVVIYRVQKQKEGIKIETPQGVTAVLGTVFLLEIRKDGTVVIVEEGKVSFTNQEGSSVEINPGEKLTASAKGKLPTPEKIDPIMREQLFGADGGKGPGLNQR